MCSRQCWARPSTCASLNEWNAGKWGALTLYFLGNFQTNDRNLVDIKKRWDPNNYFQHAQSIPIEKMHVPW